MTYFKISVEVQQIIIYRYFIYVIYIYIYIYIERERERVICIRYIVYNGKVDIC